ncbi:hypothetical protein WDW86_01190 [Bdellovibrionota bacterium FG-2]
MNQVTRFGEGFVSSFNLGFGSFMAFLPTLIGAVLILAVGWYLSTWVARLVERVLVMLKLERAAQHAGVTAFIAKTGLTVTSSGLLAEMSKWFLRLIFIQAAANLLGMAQLTTIINSIILFLPRLAVALAIIVVGAYFAGLLATSVRNSTSAARMGNADLFASLTQYCIMGFVIIAAASQLEIAPTIINTLFIGLIASLALAIGLAFGLGGQGVAGNMMKTWYEKSRSNMQEGSQRTVEVSPLTTTDQTESDRKVAKTGTFGNRQA